MDREIIVTETAREKRDQRVRDCVQVWELRQMFTVGSRKQGQQNNKWIGEIVRRQWLFGKCRPEGLRVFRKQMGQKEGVGSFRR
jgi:hypothetical protein